MSQQSLNDWLQTTKQLLEDVERAAGEVDHHGDGYTKRCFVRAVFAYVEGTVFGLKRVVLHMTNEGTHSSLSEQDLQRLTERKIPKDSNSDGAYLSFSENLKWTFQIYSKIHGFACPIKFRDTGWDSLLAAAKVRNRLMHPKASIDLEVSNDDLKRLRAGYEWYCPARNGLVKQALEVAGARQVQKVMAPFIGASARKRKL